MNTEGTDESQIIRVLGVHLWLKKVKFAPVSRILCVSRRDDHFSALPIAEKMVSVVSDRNSDQPERSAGRVSAFCLVLHRTEVALTRFVTKTPVRSYRTFSP